MNNIKLYLYSQNFKILNNPIPKKKQLIALKIFIAWNPSINGIKKFNAEANPEKINVLN